MYCKNCGNKIKDGVKFCPHCGAAINEENGRTSLNAQGNVRGKKKHKRPVIIAIIICVVVCAATGVFFVVSGNTDSTEFIGTTKGTGLTEDEASQMLLEDISEEDWEIFNTSSDSLTEIVRKYADEDGNIQEEDSEYVINTVAEKVDSFYEDGIVSWYLCDEEGVYFEYASGISAFFVPTQEGTSSGEGDIILALDPYETDSSNETMTNTAAVSGAYITDALDSYSMETYENYDVTLDLLRNLPACDVLLWNGHGAYTKCADGETRPVLITREEATGVSDSICLNQVVVSLESEKYWAITPHFVKKYFTMEQGLVYLSTCQSGRDDTMADAFFSIGAEVVFVNVGETNVRTSYTQTMLEEIIACMSGYYDNIYHTASEAMVMTEENIEQLFLDNGGVDVSVDEKFLLFFSRTVTKHYDTFEEYVEGVQGGTHVEVRGETGYTLCACIRGTISFEDGLTDDEISEIMDTLSVTLYTDDGSFVKSMTLSESEFYFNDLEPGTYRVQLYSGNEAVGQSPIVTVEAHRYNTADLIYSLHVPLEGYVYDEETGEPLSGVAVTADIKNTSVSYSAETVTDENGYYCIEVAGVNKYILSYELDEYDSVQNEIEITVEMYNNAQSGLSSILDDVYMENTGKDDELLFNGHRYKLLYAEKITWTDAKEYCEDLGGHLLTINSEEEQEAVYQYIEGFEIDADIWIGITDVDSEGDWSHWITGEEVTYTNWGDGEPDNYQSSFQDQNYGVICSGYRSGSTYYIEPGEWDDIDEYGSTVSGYFVCEWD